MACCAVAPPSDLQPSLDRVRSASANCLTPVSHVPSRETQRYSLTSLTSLTPVTSHPPCHLKLWRSVTLAENKPPLLDTSRCGAQLLKTWWFQPPAEWWCFLYRTGWGAQTSVTICETPLQSLKEIYILKTILTYKTHLDFHDTCTTFKTNLHKNFFFKKGETVLQWLKEICI